MNGVRRNTAGVTLTELLVVLLIIAILATIAVPVYLNRVETARIRTAQAEVRELAVAEDMVAAVHGFYVPLQTLDDVIEPEAGVVDQDADTIDNEPTNLYLYKVGLPPEAQLAGTNQRQLNRTDTDNDVATMIDNWQGPFINFNRFFKGLTADNRQKTNIVDSDPDEVSRDFPLDPWGQPYRIFGPLGILGNDAFEPDSFTLWNVDNKFDLAQQNRSTEQDPYDRFAIVSYGPNQIPNRSIDQVGEGDDIVYLFGFVASETQYVP